MEYNANKLKLIAIAALGGLASICLQCEESQSDKPDAKEDKNTDTDTDGDTIPTDDAHSPGCGKDMKRPDPAVQQTIDVDGTTRYYLLNVPKGADNQSQHPLIFALHGYDMNNISVTRLYDFNARSGGQAITVYPQGEGPPLSLPFLYSLK